MVTTYVELRNGKVIPKQQLNNPMQLNNNLKQAGPPAAAPATQRIRNSKQCRHVTDLHGIWRP